MSPARLSSSACAGRRAAPEVDTCTVQVSELSSASLSSTLGYTTPALPALATLSYSPLSSLLSAPDDSLYVLLQELLVKRLQLTPHKLTPGLQGETAPGGTLRPRRPRSSAAPPARASGWGRGVEASRSVLSVENLSVHLKP